jgi:hypothetical protein
MKALWNFYCRIPASANHPDGVRWEGYCEECQEFQDGTQEEGGPRDELVVKAPSAETQCDGCGLTQAEVEQEQLKEAKRR